MKERKDMGIIEILEMMMNAELCLKDLYAQVDSIVGGFENGDPEGVLQRIQEVQELVGFTQDEEASLKVLLTKIDIVQEQMNYANQMFKLVGNKQYQTYEEWQKDKNLSCQCNNRNTRHEVLLCHDFEIVITNGEITIGYYIDCIACGHLYVWPILPEGIEIDIEISEQQKPNSEDPF
jgi:hypothetical protein